MSEVEGNLSQGTCEKFHLALFPYAFYLMKWVTPWDTGKSCILPQKLINPPTKERGQGTACPAIAGDYN